jgi:hypothetical protein
MLAGIGLAIAGAAVHGLASYGIDQLNVSSTVQTIASVAATGAIATGAIMADMPAAAHGAIGAGFKDATDRVRLLMAESKAAADAAAKKAATQVSNTGGTQQAKAGLQAVNIVRELPMGGGVPMSATRLARGAG